jgi:hypothetical protein
VTAIHGRRHPSLSELVTAPELAALATLDHALQISILALAAAWPELELLEFPLPRGIDPRLRAALHILEHARRLAHLIRRYRVALRDTERRELDLPFLTPEEINRPSAVHRLSRTTRPRCT